MGYYDDCMDLVEAAWDNPELAGIAEAAGAYDMMAQMGMEGYGFPGYQNYYDDDDGYDDDLDDGGQDGLAHLAPVGQQSRRGRIAEADELARELGAPTATARSATDDQV